MSNPFAADRNIFSNISKPSYKTNINNFDKQSLSSKGMGVSSNNNTNYDYSNNNNKFKSNTNNYNIYNNNNIKFQSQQFQSNPNLGSNQIGNYNNNKINNQNNIYQPKTIYQDQKYDFNKQTNFKLSSQTNLNQYNNNNNLNSKYDQNIYMTSANIPPIQNNNNYTNNNDKNYNFKYNQNNYQNYQKDQPQYFNRHIKSQSQVEPYKKHYQSSPYNDYSKNQTNQRQKERNTTKQMFSPINQTSKHKLEQSQFMNLDAMSQDISKLLASSKNQQQLCKLLGIQRNQAINNNLNNNLNQANQQNQRNNPKKDNWVSNLNNIPQRQPELQNSQGNKNNYQNNNQGNNNVPFGFRRGTFGQPQLKIYQPQQFQGIQNNQPTFNFQKKVSGMKYQQQEQDDHVPTFVMKQTLEDKNKKEYSNLNNYPLKKNNIQQPLKRQSQIYQKQPEALKSQKQSNQQQMPRFKKVQSDIQNTPEVFNYTNHAFVNQLDEALNLQKAIKVQMTRLCTNGKYRTFLTASQKIQTVSYKFQPL